MIIGKKKKVIVTIKLWVLYDFNLKSFEKSNNREGFKIEAGTNSVNVGGNKINDTIVF